MGSLLALLLALSTAQAAPAPPPPEPALDTVILTSGGRLRGTIVEDLPDADLVILLPDGSARPVPRAQILAIEYAFPYPARLPEPPTAGEGGAPPVAEEPAPAEEGEGGVVPGGARGPPFTVSFGIGASFPLGTLDATGQRLTDVSTVLASLDLEVGWRVLPALEIAAYFRGGFSDVAKSWQGEACWMDGFACTTSDLGFGLRPRWIMAPGAQFTPWIAASVGLDWLVIQDEDYWGLSYGGWEVGASVGFDVWLGSSVGLGAQVGARLGEYAWRTTKGWAVVDPYWPGGALHGWIDAGLRLVVGVGM